MNICTKYRFNILIISGSYGGHRRHTTYNRQRTTPRVWHISSPQGSLKHSSHVYVETILILSLYFQKLRVTIFKNYIMNASPRYELTF